MRRCNYKRSIAVRTGCDRVECATALTNKADDIRIVMQFHSDTIELRHTTDLLLLDQLSISLWSPVAEELPRIANLADYVQIQIGHDQSVFIARRLGDDLATRIAEITLAVKFADVPGRFVADAVDCGDEITVGHGVRGLFELPEVFGQTRDRRRRVEDDLGAVQPQRPRAFGKVTVVADVDPDARVGRVEGRITKIARLEIELLPESRRDVRDVVLAVFA